MKEFKKYIVQGIGISIGFIITSLVCGLILGIGLVSQNIYQQTQEKRQVAIVIKQEIKKNKFMESNVSENEADRILKNGIEITQDGLYSIEVISGSGDVKIYDTVTYKHIITLVGPTESKDNEFEGKAGYIVVPDDGIKIICKQK